MRFFNQEGGERYCPFNTSIDHSVHNLQSQSKIIFITNRNTLSELIVIVWDSNVIEIYAFVKKAGVKAFSVSPESFSCQFSYIVSLWNLHIIYI